MGADLTALFNDAVGLVADTLDVEFCEALELMPDGTALRLRAGSALRLGLTAVVEDRTQGLSYWALKHAAEKPDFHRAESFQVALA